MSESARAAILGRLRAAGADGAAPQRAAAATQGECGSHEEKIERFSTLMTAVHGEVHRTTSAQWRATLAQVLAAHAARNVLYAPDTPLGQALESSDALPQRIPYAASVEAFKPTLFNEVEAAVTTARAAIAATGSLVLWPSAEEPRLMSLVPPLHVAVLAADRLYDSLEQLMNEEGWAAGMPTNALLISGPSKTADIEQTLVFGVHGPKALAVLLVEGGW